MDNPLYHAFTGEASDLDYFLENTKTLELKAQFRDMLQQLDESKAADLKAFTMAAMQGLCSSLPELKREGITNQDIDFISGSAVLIARATLTELSKHQ